MFGIDFCGSIQQRLIKNKEMRRNQLTITYPEGDAHRLRHTLLQIKTSRFLNVSAFCRQAIAEKLERLEQVEAKEVVE